MRNIDTVIFDMDGTLLDTLEDLKNAVNYSMRKFGFPERTKEEVRRFVGNGQRKLIERAIPEGLNNPLYEETFQTMKTYYTAHSNVATDLYPGIGDMVKTLVDEGYKVAIVSNKLDGAVKDLTKEYFKDTVKVAIGNRDGIATKPAPDTVVEALKELGSVKERAVYVGDSEVDIKTAENSGMPCISVLWGFRDEEELRNCGGKNFARSAEEVLEFVRKETFI